MINWFSNRRFIFPLLAAVSGIFFGVRHFWTDILFYGDIARDFLLVEDIVFQKNIVLIGARASIPGVFHGPFWNYLHVPVAFLSQGNPAAVQLFWFVMLSLSIGVMWFVVRKWFGSESAWLAASLGFLRLSVDSRNLINPAGAVLPLVLFFAFWIRFIRENKLNDGLLAFLFVGLVIQSQMALGGPLLVLSCAAVLRQAVRLKRVRLLLTPLAVGVTTASFWVFELRNNFPQARGVLAFLTGEETHGKMLLLALIQNRLRGAVLGFNLVEIGPLPSLVFVIGLFVTTLYLLWKRGDELQRSIAQWYLYFYGGFWALSLLYGGVVWAFYYAPFSLLSVAVFAGGWSVWPRKLFTVVFFFVFLLQLSSLVKGFPDRASFSGKDTASWLFHRQIAETVFNDAPEEFGYYVYTADQYGYSSKYALHFIQRLRPEKRSVSYEKRPVTYLVIEPNTDNPYTNDQAWKFNQVKISREPSRVWKYDNGYRLERYDLDAKEVSVVDDHLLLDGIQLR